MKKIPLKKWWSTYVHNHFNQIVIFFTLFLIPNQYINAHGTVTSPPSRVWVCFQENPESPDSPACEAAIIGWGTQAFYDWSEVARMDAGGMHRAIIGDGNLASAGRPDKFGGLDQTRDDWVATPVEPGPFTVTWTNSAPHQTLYYRVYITKADWTPDQPLTWDSLELLVETEPRPAAVTDDIDVVLPERTGKHVIYSIWQRSLTPEAFYSTSDVDFGSAPQENVAPIAAFTSDNGICGGPEVAFSAQGSYDPNGDDLVYNWDFGDGTTAEGFEVTHIFANGLETSDVTLTVSDGEFSSGVAKTINLLVDPQCQEPVCPYGTPIASALPSVNTTYQNIHVIGDLGPNLSNISSFTINWELSSNGLYQLSMNTNDGQPSWYTNLISVSTHSFSAEEPQITITNSGFPDLDGSYYVTVDGDNFVMVSVIRGFTLYFSNSETPPNCDDISVPTINTPPIANLIATPSVGTAPLQVTFDASGSTDVDGDTLTYSIDYGDETFGTGAISTHTYPAGEYTAMLTVDDGQGGVDSALITIIVTDDIDAPTNTPPVVNLIADPTSGVAPLEVTFDASGSTDADGDTLTFSIDYGDGTFGSEAVSSHIYDTGEYFATMTVSDGQGGSDTTTVNIIVEDDIVISPPTVGCSFNTPIETALPSIYGSYENIHVLGTGGPDLENTAMFTINWDLANNSLYQFSFNFNAAPWYLNFSNATQNFNTTNPRISITNSGITGLDGDYYVTTDNENFVLVSINQDFTIYFSNSATAPNCEVIETAAKNIKEEHHFTMYPNPAVSNFTINNTMNLNGSTIKIIDIAGKQVKSLSVKENTTDINIDIFNTKSGLYIVKILNPNGYSKTLKLIVK